MFAVWETRRHYSATGSIPNFVSTDHESVIRIAEEAGWLAPEAALIAEQRDGLWQPLQLLGQDPMTVRQQRTYFGVRQLGHRWTGHRPLPMPHELATRTVNLDD